MYYTNEASCKVHLQAHEHLDAMLHNLCATWLTGKCSKALCSLHLLCISVHWSCGHSWLNLVCCAKALGVITGCKIAVCAASTFEVSCIGAARKFQGCKRPQTCTTTSSADCSMLANDAFLDEVYTAVASVQLCAMGELNTASFAYRHLLQGSFPLQTSSEGKARDGCSTSPYN